MLLLGTAWLFHSGVLSAVTMTACWCVVLFFASAGASAAYLTVGEIFPMETRAMAIAFFYAIGTAAGGITGPLLFARLVGSGQVGDTVLAFVIGASIMIIGGLVELALGVKATPSPPLIGRGRRRVTAAGRAPARRPEPGPCGSRRSRSRSR
ncbi:hypothetical protein [Micromonospora sp. NPDC049282]|uniref:hypothetical protein n=1 Tax=Micromonospora sp. NPDC049282 TaxID=3364269 RepID=UPI003721AB2B